MSDDIDPDRKFSNGTDWDNSIDWDDASDGSDGGYDRHGSPINANAMKELVQLRMETSRLRADLSAVTSERDAAKKSAYEDAARFIEENVFNYSSGDQNYWSHRKGDNTHGLEYAREFRKKAAAIRSGK